MPTVRKRVTLCPMQSGQPAWILEFPIWWNRSEFLLSFGHRQIDTGNPNYVDYALLLAGWEALAWDKHCREEFAEDPRSQEPYFVNEMQRWQTMLEVTSWVIVESYEWESGIN